MNVAVPEKLCQLRERVSERIGATRYRTWFGDAARFHVDGNHVTVWVGNSFVRGWIAANYGPALDAVARELLGPDVVVTVAVDDAGEPGAAPAPPPPPRPARLGGGSGSGSGSAAALRGELDTLVVGAGNQLAISAARRLCDSAAGHAAPLVIHGGCGLGKTHLLQGICNAMRRVRPELHWRYASGEEFTNDFIAALRGGRVDVFRAQHRALDLLVIDDLHFLANKKATQEEFLHTYNAVTGAGRPVVFSSDRHPREIATLSEPLINRLVSGMVVEIQPPDFAMRREILARRAASLRVTLPDETIDYVARAVTRNVRELEGALYKIVALASLSKGPVTMELARLAVEDYASRVRSPEAVTIERAAAEYFGIRPEQIRSKSRDRTVSLARSVSVFLIRRHTHMSYPEIGRLIGSRNHSTVLMATQRVEATLRENGAVTWKAAGGARSERLRDLVAAIEKVVSGG
ncbi:MAG: chromosomal replication initiator protein DnaA [Planctomycetia bacterium]|nr:MAG: chromosomal replication initiator protein DnaA [Planctomycetia bacterium]